MSFVIHPTAAIRTKGGEVFVAGSEDELAGFLSASDVSRLVDKKLLVEVEAKKPKAKEETKEEAPKAK